VNLTDFAVSDRVKDREGLRGHVTSVGRKYVHVTLDTSQLLRQYLPGDLTRVTPLMMPRTRPVRVWSPPAQAPPQRREPPRPLLLGDLLAPEHTLVARSTMRTNARQRRLTRNGADRYNVMLPLVSDEPGVMIPTRRPA
jgi:hypothetical protein